MDASAYMSSKENDTEGSKDFVGAADALLGDDSGDLVRQILRDDTVWIKISRNRITLMFER